MNYRDDLAIDKHNLDEEVMRQPELYALYAELSAKANNEKDKAKVNTERVYAIADNEIRKELKKENLKLTDAAIKSQILNNIIYQEAQDDYLEAKYKADLLSVAEKSFEQRKSNISKLCELFQTGYYARVKTKWNGKKVSTIKDIEKRAIEDIKKQIMQKKKK